MILTKRYDPIFGIWNTVAGGDSTASVSSSGGGSGNYVPNENPGRILDNNTLTKYFNHGNGDWTVYSITKGIGTGFYITPTVGLSILREFRVATADDRPLRDPLSVTIECSNSTSNSLTYSFSWILVYTILLAWEQGKLRVFTCHTKHQEAQHTPDKEFFFKNILTFFNNTL
jgi:hypothetical protein